MMEPQLAHAALMIRNAERIVVFTGAGMSADSGVATFRNGGSGNLWGGIRGMIALAWFGVPIGWTVTPGWAWRAYLDEFYGSIARAGPHEGHRAIAALERRFQEKITVVTMNVDGFHSEAGNHNVAEVHGTVNRLRCKRHGILQLPLASVEEMQKYRCPVCGGHIRPDVVLFTEGLPENEWSKAVTACRQLTPRDCMIVIGTTGAVYPAAGLPETAIARGVRVIEINLDPSPISSSVHVFLQGRAKTIVPKLTKLVLGDQYEEPHD